MKANITQRLRLPAIIIASLFFVLGIFVLVAFYIKPPSAIRIVANTASFTLEIPPDSDIHTRLSWPLSGGILCNSNNDGSFTLEDSASEEADCSGIADLSGTLWFQPGAIVNVSMQNRRQFDIQIDHVSTDIEPLGVVLRNRKGIPIKVNAPARIRVSLPTDGTSSPIVLPVVSRIFKIGQEVSWQALTTKAILQHGNVALVRKSFFGDILFPSEEFALVLGDWLRLESEGTDYVQGVVQIKEGSSIDVAVTASGGNVWLHRFARDPLHLDTPLAAQLIKDPTLILVWGILALIIGGWLRLIEIRIASSHKT